MERTGIILLNLGGPDTQEAVRPFLRNLFSDRQIIRLGPTPLQRPLAWLISTLRAPKVRESYARIGGGSPILETTEAQARALEERLRAQGDCRVYVAMRYWHPFSQDAVSRAAADGVRRVMAFPLYPQYSIATTGSSEAALLEALKPYDLPYASVSHWYDHPRYLAVLRKRIHRDLHEDTHVLFSAHSLPVSFIEAGDPYQRHVEATVRALAEGLPAPWSLAYQSRTGPVKWLGPSVEESLHDLAGKGVRDVLAVPVSFVSDHIETLYEIDILYREMAAARGLVLRRTESLNADPEFIAALADIVLEKMREARWH